MNSKHGCPIFGLTALWRWIEANRYIIGLFLLGVGVTLVEFGGKHYLASMFTISTFAMMVFVLTLLFYFVLPTTSPQWLVWIVVFACLGIGAGLGYGAYQWPKLGVIVISIFTGCIFGTVFYTIFFSDINDKKLDRSIMTINEKISNAADI